MEESREIKIATFMFVELKTMILISIDWVLSSSGPGSHMCPVTSDQCVASRDHDTWDNDQCQLQWHSPWSSLITMRQCELVPDKYWQCWADAVNHDQPCAMFLWLWQRILLSHLLSWTIVSRPWPPLNNEASNIVKNNQSQLHHAVFNVSVSTSWHSAVLPHLCDQSD